MKKLLLPFLIFCFMGCSDKAEVEKLESKIEELENEVDLCKNGADKLLAKIEHSFESENYQELKSNFREIKDRHPESDEYIIADSLNKVVLNIEEELRQEKIKEREAEKAEKLKALKKLKKEEDDVSGITWYKNPYFTHYNNSNLTSLYMGYNSRPWLRLRMSYTGDGWIFFEKAFLSFEGNTMEFHFNKYREKETDNGSGGVWEWIDIEVPENKVRFLRDLANSKEAKMRLTGKYTKTRNLSRNERQGILDVLNAYEVLKEEY